MGGKKNGAGQLSPLRAALAAKQTLRTYFDVAVADSAAVEAAQRKVDVARQLVAATLLHKDDDVQQRAEAELTAAEAARGECFHRIWFRGLGEPEFDALVTLHPPSKAQADDGWLWNPDTFNYALLEAGAIDSDLTAEEWEAELADTERWTRPDKNRLISACLAANQQTMADAVPKG